MTSTLAESNEAMEKMNFIADNFILAGYAIVGCLASYATYKIVTKYFIKPFASTYRFLTNQSRDVDTILAEKYGKGLAIICGSNTNMKNAYGKYLEAMGYETIVLFGGDLEALEKQKQELLKRRADRKGNKSRIDLHKLTVLIK